MTVSTVIYPAPKRNLTSIRTITFALLLLAIVLPCVHTYAQVFKTSVSEPFKSPGPAAYRRIGSEFISLERDNGKALFGYTFKLHKVKFGLTLRRYDSAMNLIKEQPLFGGEKKAGPFPPYLGTFNGKLYILYFLYEKEEEDVTLLMAEVDPVSLTISGEKVLLTMDQKNTGLIKTWDAYANLNIQIAGSPDNSRLLLWWASELNNQFSYCILDRNLALVSKKYETVKEATELYRFSGCIDNEGRVYISYRFSKVEGEWKNKVAIYENDKKIKEHTIQAQLGSLFQIQVVASRKDKLVHVVGSYSEKPSKLNGIFHQTISTADQTLNPAASILFQASFVEQLTKDDWASTKEKSYGIDPLTFSGYPLEDGRLALAGEFRKVTRTERAQYDASGSVVYAIIDGKTATVGSIPKYRVSAGSTIGDSYAAFAYKNTLLVFYNDNQPNLDRDITKPPVPSNEYKRSVLAVAFMNSDGTIKRQGLIDLTKEGFLAIGDAAQPFAGNKLMVPTYKIKGLGGVGNDRKWSTVTIE